MRPTYEVTETPPYHSHRQPRAPLVIAFVAVAVLALVVALVTVYATRVENRIDRLEDYVAGKGEQRDRERVQLQELMRELDREAACDLLDQFPQGGWLDRPRAKYGCGPGIPVEQLSPEEQEQLAGRGRANIAPPAPEPQSPAPDMGAPAVPAPPRTPANEPPPPAAEPEPSAEPATPSAITDLACGLADVCR